MNAIRIALSVVLVGFLSLTALVLHQHGLAGFVEWALKNTATTLLSVDLVIALSLAGVWMWTDARARGGSAVPYLVITLLAGSAGPLLYLIRRPSA